MENSRKEKKKKPKAMVHLLAQHAHSIDSSKPLA
jgi:hypothetical protein